MTSPRPTLRSRSPQPSGRVLAVDYGRRRIGLALSDELSLTATPLITLQRKNRREDIRRLRDIARKHAVTLILVGFPLHLAGHAGELAEEAARFAARIQKELGVSVMLRDERLTTWEAGEISKGPLAPRNCAKKNLDSIAAAIFLREYLDEIRGGESLQEKA